VYLHVLSAALDILTRSAATDQPSLVQALRQQLQDRQQELENMRQVFALRLAELQGELDAERGKGTSLQTENDALRREVEQVRAVTPVPRPPTPISVLQGKVRLWGTRCYGKSEPDILFNSPAMPELCLQAEAPLAKEELRRLAVHVVELKAKVDGHEARVVSYRMLDEGMGPPYVGHLEADGGGVALRTESWRYPLDLNPSSLQRMHGWGMGSKVHMTGSLNNGRLKPARFGLLLAALPQP
jgi:hypothetical protein